jgi:hypothetical protein
VSCQEVSGNFFIYFLRHFAQKFFGKQIIYANYGLAAHARLADYVGVEAFMSVFSEISWTIDFVFFLR